MKTCIKNSYRHLVMVFVLSFLLIGGTSSGAETQNETRVLLDQASYWQFNGREDLAESIWKKIIRIEPQQTEALFGLGIRSAQRGKLKAARSYLDRIRTLDHLYAKRLEAAIKLGRIDPKGLEKARLLAQSGKIAESVAVYKDLWGKRRPEGALELEYYLTLGGLPEGWELASAQLQRLVKENPEISYYRLALGKHLTYRKKTRRKGIHFLEQIADIKNIKEAVTLAWRDALLWLEIKSKDKKSYLAFIERNPEAKKVRQKWKKYQALSHRNRLLRQGQRALKSGELDKAEKQFNKVLRKAPKDPAALGGLGLVKLKQQQFHHALDLFKKASSISKQASKNWKKARQTAQYWVLFSDANIAREAKQFERAEDLLKQARALAPKDLQGDLILAEVLVAQGQLAEAENIYREIIDREASHHNAMIGLINVLISQGNIKEAMPLVTTLSAEDPRVQIAKSRIFQADGRYNEAMDEVNKLLENNPLHINALLEKANILSLLENISDALRVLDQIPEESRTDSSSDFQKRLWIRYQAERASGMRELGLPGLAHKLVETVNARIGDDPKYFSALADSWSQVGETEKALKLLHNRIEVMDIPNAGLYLQLSGLLLREGKYEALEKTLQSLNSMTNLSAQERRALKDVETGYIVKQSDLARESGKFATAYEWLSAARSEDPGNTSLAMALARLYESSKDYANAFQIYNRVLSSEPANRDAWTGIVNVLINKHDYNHAEAWLKKAIRHYPNDQELLILSGRIHKTKGSRRDALRFFQMAQVHPNNLEMIGPHNVKNSSSDINVAKRTRTLDETGSKININTEIATLSAAGKIRSANKILREDSEQVRSRMSALQPEIDALSIRSNGQKTGAAVVFKSRKGESGLSELSNFSLPAEFGMNVREETELLLWISPVILDAGFIQNQDAANRFGSNILTGSPITRSDGQNEKGIAAGIGFTWDTFTFEGGSSPLGFLIVNPVGEIRWRPRINQHVVLGIDLSQREVRDSFLSYAGTRDTRTGKSWGGVISTGGNIEIGYDEAGFGIYGNVSYRNLTGKNVKNNQLFSVNTGFYRPFNRTEDITFAVGFNANYHQYEKNLRFFTFGHGGYFSPQSYYTVNTTLDMSGRRKALSYRISGSLGIQSFNEDAVPLFPSDSKLQSDLNALAVLDATIKTKYQAKNETGIIYNIRGEWEYLVMPKISVGGYLTTSRARDYDDRSIVFYVRHWLGAKEIPVSFPPKPFRIRP